MFFFVIKVDKTKDFKIDINSNNRNKSPRTIKCVACAQMTSYALLKCQHCGVPLPPKTPRPAHLTPRADASSSSSDDSDDDDEEDDDDDNDNDNDDRDNNNDDDEDENDDADRDDERRVTDSSQNPSSLSSSSPSPNNTIQRV